MQKRATLHAWGACRPELPAQGTPHPGAHLQSPAQAYPLNQPRPLACWPAFQAPPHNNNLTPSSGPGPFLTGPEGLQPPDYIHCSSGSFTRRPDRERPQAPPRPCTTPAQQERPKANPNPPEPASLTAPTPTRHWSMPLCLMLQRSHARQRRHPHPAPRFSQQLLPAHVMDPCAPAREHAGTQPRAHLHTHSHTHIHKPAQLHTHTRTLARTHTHSHIHKAPRRSRSGNVPHHRQCAYFPRMLMPARMTSSTNSSWLATTGALCMICKHNMGVAGTDGA